MQVTRRSIRPAFIEVWRLDDIDQHTLVPLLSSRAPIVVDDALRVFLSRSEPQVCDDEQPSPAAVGDAAGETSIIVRLAVAGESVGLLEVLDEAIERAAAVVAEREGLTDLEKVQIAEVIGTGAVKYAELSQHRMTDYKFSWDKMLALQGNTAPYLINAYVRTRAIFRKLDGTFTIPTEVSFTDPAERALALKLAQFAEATHDVLEDHRPNTLANYLYELANAYHSFYEACPVLRSEGTMRETRLLLCQATSQVLRSGLNLLGIQTTERM
jgi:arginyl-tRNA synthetase